MLMVQVNTLLLLVCTACFSAAVAFLCSRFFYSAHIRELLARLERANKARVHTNDMLIQARRQAETLQQELVHARRPRAVAAAAPTAFRRNTAQADALRLLAQNDGAHAKQSPVVFADTRPMSGFGATTH